MNNQTKYLDQSSFERFFDLSAKLVESRQIALCTILEMSALSLTRGEKLAWIGLYKIWRYIEEYHHFPSKERIAQLLNSDEFEHKDLTECDLWNYRDTLLALDSVRKDFEEQSKP